MKKISIVITSLSLALGLTSFSANATQLSSSDSQVLRVNHTENDAAKGYIWYDLFQCMVEETKGGSDWSTASEACESLFPTDPPSPTDPEVPDSPIRLGSNR